jgi:hypothetical protein
VRYWTRQVPLNTSWPLIIAMNYPAIYAPLFSDGLSWIALMTPAHSHSSQYAARWLPHVCRQQFSFSPKRICPSLRSYLQNVSIQVYRPKSLEIRVSRFAFSGAHTGPNALYPSLSFAGESILRRLRDIMLRARTSKQWMPLLPNQGNCFPRRHWRQQRIRLLVQ